MLPDLPQTEIAIVQMTNAFRKENSLGEVKPNAALTAAARAFAQYLANTGKFAHEADGRGPAERVAEKGYRFCMISENLALNGDSRGFETYQLARQAVEGWKNSPGHRANMLTLAATEIGVAVARAPDGNPKFISVQLFGRPRGARLQFRVENRSAAPVRYALGTKLHVLPAHGIATHAGSACEPQRLMFDRPGGNVQRFEPSTGDRFVARPGAGGVTVIQVERK